MRKTLITAAATVALLGAGVPSAGAQAETSSSNPPPPADVIKGAINVVKCATQPYMGWACYDR